MGFIETLVPAAPALIEKNKPKRIFNKGIEWLLGMPLGAQTPTFDVEPFCLVCQVGGFGIS